MAFFNPRSGQRSRCMLMIQVFAVQLLGMLACLASTALAQFEVGESLTASASLPDVAITCVGNLSVFFTCLLRGGLNVEMGVRDLLATITPPKLVKEGSALKTRHGSPGGVVMLSHSTPESSIMQFMEYISNTHDVDSVLLQYHRLRSDEFTAETCNNAIAHQCRCIVIEAMAEDIKFLVSLIPGVLKQLTDSQILLPCMTCLTNVCHGCNHGMLHVYEDEDGLRLTEAGPKEWPVPVVCEIFDKIPLTIYKERCCICIPLFRAEDDKWTKMLIRCLKTKDQEDRGVRDQASDALERYIAQSGVCDAGNEYTTYYGTILFIMPRLTEILINIILTAWFRVDGFSSSLVARRVIRGYIVDSRGTEIAANVFLQKYDVYSNAENTNVCQVLTFRGNLLNFRTLSFIIGGVNLMCSISWCVLIAIPGNWYDTLSMPPSKARIVILIAAIGIALLMDCLEYYLGMKDTKKSYNMLLFVMILEIVYIIVGSALVGTLGIRSFGKWIYSAIQVLVWVKWGFGSYFLGARSYDKDERLAPWAFDVSGGHGLMCASAFLLNAVLAGVRGHWKYSRS